MGAVIFSLQASLKLHVHVPDKEMCDWGFQNQVCPNGKPLVANTVCTLKKQIQNVAYIYMYSRYPGVNKRKFVGPCLSYSIIATIRTTGYLFHIQIPILLLFHVVALKCKIAVTCSFPLC